MPQFSKTCSLGYRDGTQTIVDPYIRPCGAQISEPAGDNSLLAELHAARAARRGLAGPPSSGPETPAAAGAPAAARGQAKGAAGGGAALSLLTWNLWCAPGSPSALHVHKTINAEALIEGWLCAGKSTPQQTSSAAQQSASQGCCAALCQACKPGGRGYCGPCRFPGGVRVPLKPKPLLQVCGGGGAGGAHGGRRPRHRPDRPGSRGVPHLPVLPGALPPPTLHRLMTVIWRLELCGKCCIAERVGRLHNGRTGKQR